MPGYEHDLTAKPAGVDACVDFACSRERETVDYDGMNGAVAQQVKQRGHISLEIVGVRRSACGDAIEHGVTAAEQAAQHVPQLEPRQTECR